MEDYKAYMEMLLYLQINICSFVICLILLFHHKKKNIDVIGNRAFDVILIAACIVLVLDSASWMIEGRTFFGCREIYTLILNLNFIVQIVPCLYLFIYTMDEKQSVMLRKKGLAYIPFGIGIVLVILNLFRPYIFTLNEQNIYIRQEGFFIMGAIPVCYLLATFLNSIRNYARIDGADKQTYKHFMIAVVMIVAGAVAQIILYGLETIWMMVAVCMVYLYINVQSQREEQMRVELEKGRVAIMLSQIQPHFLYNALSSITALCDEDPKEAKQATIDFSNFLRGNMDSLVADKPITFEKELEHTKRYLSLESLRFPDKLNVVYDIQTTMFRVPTLTLQPIVENAVRYGVTKRRNGGTIWISTKEREQQYILTVKDDGVGFDTGLLEGRQKKNSMGDMQKYNEKDKAGRSHVGIMNVRERIEHMSGGTMHIHSEAGAGTEVTIIIPKYQEK